MPYNVYVVELDSAVLKEHKRFRDENPNHVPGMACLYVGMTGLTPKERFENHRQGVRASKYVRKYGLWLRPRLYQRYNPMTWEEALAKEIELADRLRAKGYAVWQK